MVDGGQTWIERALFWLRDEQAGHGWEADLSSAEADELNALVHGLVELLQQEAPDAGRVRLLLQLTAAKTVELCREQDTCISPDALVVLYEACHPLDATAAAHVLQMLAAQRDEESTLLLAEQIAQLPPSDWKSAAVSLSPLWNAPGQTIEVFFEKLGGDFVHPATMAVLLDLANYAARTRKIVGHPWQEQSAGLQSVLRSVVSRLRLLEEDPARFGESVEEVQQTLGDSIAITVSLCDALGLIGSEDAKEALVECLGLSHRRIQTEAAGALSRIGDERGRERLILLASDRAARLRAVAYAEELGIVDEIDAGLRTPQALAESELAAWLAGPDQFGFPPQEVELVDVKTMYWPGYEEPRDCYLFRYTFELPTGRVSNIGIAGPCAHAFQADLGNLPADDIYAAFAGWQAEHEEIFEVPVTSVNQAQRREVDRLMADLEESGHEEIVPMALTFLLGEISLLATATIESGQCCVITDGTERVRFSISKKPTSITPEVVLCIYRGRKLLRSFND